MRPNCVRVRLSFRENFMKLKALITAALTLLLVSAATAQPPQGDPGGPGNARTIRGTVTAIAPPFVTIKTDDGETWQVKLGPNARVIKRSGAMRGERGGRHENSDTEQTPPEPIKITDIHVGDTLAAGGDIDSAAKKVNAAFGFVIDAATVKQLQADWGVTYIAGKITALNADDAKITVQRPDGKLATVQADESTSFRKGHDSITLADIKVGDTVTGRGAIKNGVFTPATLVVFDPNARRGARNHGGDTPPATPSTAPPPSLQ
jgi:hypothetical protein